MRSTLGAIVSFFDDAPEVEFLESKLPEKKGIYSVSPPSVFYDPQLQIICCYIARYYVRKWHVHLGGIKNLC